MRALLEMNYAVTWELWLWEVGDGSREKAADIMRWRVALAAALAALPTTRKVRP